MKSLPCYPAIPSAARRPVLRLLFAATIVAVLSFIPSVRAQDDAPDASPAPSASPTPTPPALASLAPVAAKFYTPRTVLWLGRSTVLPFQVAQAPAADLTLNANLANSTTVEILRPATILAGKTTGFVRVRGLQPGRSRLLLRGAGDSAAVDLEIKPDPAAAVMGQVDPESGRPQIISPVPDAVVWGQFAVGVEVFDRFARPSPTDEPPPANPKDKNAPAVLTGTGGTRVQLRLPSGRLLDPVAQTGPEIGPGIRCQFSVQASDLPSGPAKLVAIAFPAAFSDVDRRSNRPGLVLESEPVTLDSRPAPPAALWAGECEDPAVMGESKELYAPARPVAQNIYGTRLPAVENDGAASGGKTVACPGGDTAWSLPFHVKNPGMYQLFVQTRGDLACGAFPSLALFLGSNENPVGVVRLSGPKYARVPVGTPVRLEEGPRAFTVAFRNDFNIRKEDRNVSFDRYEVARVGDLPPEPPKPEPPGKPDPAKGNKKPASPAAPVPAPAVASATGAPALTPLPPEVRVLYPANGAPVYGIDAVVAQLAGNTARAVWADVLVDGQPQGLRVQGPALAEGGPLVFPLPARQLETGPHRLTVRVADSSGQTADSTAREFRVLDAVPPAPGTYERAVYLLDRFAFGPEERELAAVLTMGEARWLNARLAAGFDTAEEQALLKTACTQNPQLADERQVVHRALAQWLGSANPVRSRFTAWAENHFSTWISKTEGEPKWREHLAFCQVGVAPFADLLSVSAHSPAMLKYLDQERSYAGKLNENYAREIMELHTLGVHGGYAQTDVTALAGVLNGWTTTREVVLPQQDGALGLNQPGGNNGWMLNTFQFDPYLNDGKEREVFGLRFPATRNATTRHDHVRLAMEMLATHPGTADHVCRKLAEHYVGTPAPDGLVRALADTFLSSGGDMRAVLVALAGHPDFWRAPARLATPLDFGLRTMRLCRSTLPAAQATDDLKNRPGQLFGFLKRSGMGLFDRVTPDGYPNNGANYADSNALLQRWRFMQTLNDGLNRLVPVAWRTPAATVATPAGNDPAAPAPGGAMALDAGQRFIDLAAARLTGRLLDSGSNQAALEVLGQGTPEQMKRTLVFISLLPETSLR